MQPNKGIIISLPLESIQLMRLMNKTYLPENMLREEDDTISSTNSTSESQTFNRHSFKRTVKMNKRARLIMESSESENSEESKLKVSSDAGTSTCRYFTRSQASMVRAVKNSKTTISKTIDNSNSKILETEKQKNPKTYNDHPCEKKDEFQNMQQIVSTSQSTKCLLRKKGRPCLQKRRGRKSQIKRISQETEINSTSDIKNNLLSKPNSSLAVNETDQSLLSGCNLFFDTDSHSDFSMKPSTVDNFVTDHENSSHIHENINDAVSQKTEHPDFENELRVKSETYQEENERLHESLTMANLCSQIATFCDNDSQKKAFKITEAKNVKHAEPIIEIKNVGTYFEHLTDNRQRSPAAEVIKIETNFNLNQQTNDSMNEDMDVKIPFENCSVNTLKNESPKCLIEKSFETVDNKGKTSFENDELKLRLQPKVMLWDLALSNVLSPDQKNAIFKTPTRCKTLLVPKNLTAFIDKNVCTSSSSLSEGVNEKKDSELLDTCCSRRKKQKSSYRKGRQMNKTLAETKSKQRRKSAGQRIHKNGTKNSKILNSILPLIQDFNNVDFSVTSSHFGDTESTTEGNTQPTWMTSHEKFIEMAKPSESDQDIAPLLCHESIKFEEKSWPNQLDDSDEIRDELDASSDVSVVTEHATKGSGILQPNVDKCSFSKSIVEKDLQQRNSNFCVNSDFLGKDIDSYSKIPPHQAHFIPNRDTTCIDESIQNRDLLNNNFTWYPALDTVDSVFITTPNASTLNSPVPENNFEIQQDIPVLHISEQPKKDWNIALDVDGIDLLYVMNSTSVKESMGDSMYDANRNSILNSTMLSTPHQNIPGKQLPKIIEDQILAKDTIPISFFDTKYTISHDSRDDTDVKQNSTREMKHAKPSQKSGDILKNAVRSIGMHKDSENSQFTIAVPESTKNVNSWDFENLSKFCPEIESFFKKEGAHTKPSCQSETFQHKANDNFLLTYGSKNHDSRGPQTDNATNSTLPQTNCTETRSINNGQLSDSKESVVVHNLTMENLSKFNKSYNYQKSSLTWYTERCNYHAANKNNSDLKDSTNNVQSTSQEDINSTIEVGGVPCASSKDSKHVINNCSYDEQVFRIPCKRKRQWIPKKEESTKADAKKIKLDRKRWQSNCTQSSSQSHHAMTSSETSNVFGRLQNSNEEANFGCGKANRKIEKIAANANSMERKLCNSNEYEKCQDPIASFCQIDKFSETLFNQIANDVSHSPAPDTSKPYNLNSINNNFLESTNLVQETPTDTKNLLDMNGNCTSAGSSSSSSTTSSLSVSCSSIRSKTTPRNLKCGVTEQPSTEEIPPAKCVSPGFSHDSIDKLPNEESTLMSKTEVHSTANNEVVQKSPENDDTDDRGDSISLFAESISTRANSETGVPEPEPESNKLLPNKCEESAHESYQNITDFGTFRQKNFEECIEDYNEVPRISSVLWPDNEMVPVTVRNHVQQNLRLSASAYNTNQSVVPEPQTSQLPPTYVSLNNPDCTVPYVWRPVHRYFKNHCFRMLRQRRCHRRTCPFNHSLMPPIENLTRDPEMAMEVMNSAIDQGFVSFIKCMYLRVVMEMDSANILVLFHKLYNADRIDEEIASGTVQALLNAGLPLPSIVRNLATLLNDYDNITPQHIVTAVSSLVKDGEYWQTLRDLLIRTEPPEISLGALVYECIYTNKSKSHIEDIYNNYIKLLTPEQLANINIGLKTKLENLLLQYNIIPENSDERPETEDLYLRSNDVASVHDNEDMAIASVDSIDTSLNQQDSNCFHETYHPTSYQSNLHMHHLQEPLSRSPDNISVSTMINEQLVHRRDSNGSLINNEPSTSRMGDTLLCKEISYMEWNLYEIDDLPPVQSVWRDRNWKFYLDLESLKLGLQHQDYEHVVAMLTKYSEADKTLFTTHCYNMLHREVLTAANHVINIVDLSGNPQFQNRIQRLNGILHSMVQMGVDRLIGKALFTLGTYTMIELCNVGAWVLAYRLYKLLKSTNVPKNSTGFAIISAEVCLANWQPLKALAILKQYDMLNAKGSSCDDIKNPNDQLVRVRTINLLLEVLCQEFPDRAFRVIEYLLIDQAHNYYPIDLTAFLDKLALNLIRRNDYLLIDLTKFIIINNFALRNHTFRSLIGKIFEQDVTLSRRLFRYATRLGIYPMQQFNVPLHVIIKTHWTKEEIYLTMLEFFDNLEKEIGPAIDRVGARQFSIYLIFEVLPVAEVCEVNRIVYSDTEELEMSTTLAKSILLNEFNPPIKTILAKMGRFLKLQSLSVVNYLKSRIHNN